MYIYLGLDVLVKDSDIIGFFDLENSTISKHTRNFLKIAQEKGEVIDVCTDIPKSFVIVQNQEEKKQAVYITQISALTIRKRNIRSYEIGGDYVR